MKAEAKTGQRKEETKIRGGLNQAEKRQVASRVQKACSEVSELEVL